ncbi:MAG TPA: DUF4276 family protein [Pirellulales bacterium]|nr:DUF4276 family protein [Pirellulales bacterium]
MSGKIYIEGGGDSKELHARCREGFRKLLEKCGFGRRMPRLVACGGRRATFDDFSTAHTNAVTGAYVAMLVDSEEPMKDIEQAWAHLKQHDGWAQPAGASDEQVLLMTTCMESWIASDRQSLRSYFPACLNENALPALTNMETRAHDAVHDALVRATRKCKTPYAKGKQSFEIVGRLDPTVMRQHLPSFARCERVLRARL